MKVTVTGGSGFIGTHLTPELRMKGYDVVSVSNTTIDPQSDAFHTYAFDITVGKGLEKIFQGSNAVIHLAARNHKIKDISSDPLALYRNTNVEGTRNVIQAAKRCGVGVFIHISSVIAMGEGSECILDENSSCNPKTPYGISKLESEEVVKSESADGGMRAVIVRLPMTYGPRNKGNLPRMIRWADKGWPFPIFQPENLRSMIYVENVVAGILAILNVSPESVPTYILKDGEDYSAPTVYSEICRALGRPPRFLPVPNGIVRIGKKVSDDFKKVTGSFRVSSGKIEKEIGFFPPFSLKEGISRTVAWYMNSGR